MSLHLSQKESALLTDVKITEDEPCLEEGTVILQPIAMRFPNKQGVYSLSKLRPQKEMSYVKFFSQYIDQAKRVLVCFDETPAIDVMAQKSELVKAYGVGRDGWYIVTSEGFDNGPSK